MSPNGQELTIENSSDMEEGWRAIHEERLLNEGGKTGAAGYSWNQSPIKVSQFYVSQREMGVEWGDKSPDNVVVPSLANVFM